MFSFNSPQGMCPECDGLGFVHTFDPELLVPDPSKSIRKGAIELVGSFREMGRWRRHIYEGLASTVGFSLDVPWNELDGSAHEAMLYGTGDRHITFVWRSRGRAEYHGGAWEGVIPGLLTKFRRTASPMHRAMYEKYMRILECNGCKGMRLNPQARNVRVGGMTLVSLGAMAIDALDRFFAGSVPETLSKVEWIIASEIVKEIRARLGFLLNVGLGYLSLDRPAPTLSGGELQRIRLAGQIGSGLVGVLYVLDEPSIGLHPRDNARLLATLAKLRDQGNTVLVVEHDEETMRAADYIVDFGPGPGVRGGYVVAQGQYADIIDNPESLTGKYLNGQEQIEIPAKRRPVDLKSLRVKPSKKAKRSTEPKVKPSRAKGKKRGDSKH
jgi:excinuclease ABC subunit A